MYTTCSIIPVVLDCSCEMASTGTVPISDMNASYTDDSSTVIDTVDSVRK